MTNHGRNRQPRRRGFDDDFTYDRAPSLETPRYQSAPASPSSFGPEVSATVKWFNGEKGFGFVELADGSGDVFLHASALTQAGVNAVNPGATLKVRVGRGQKGRQVSEVLSVDDSTAQAAPARSGPRPGGNSFGGGGGGGGMGGGGARRAQPDMSAAVEMRGTVKWYNPTKGFGFVALPDGGKDVFVHASALQRGGLTDLAEGQSVFVDVVQGAKGPEAASIRLG